MKKTKITTRIITMLLAVALLAGSMQLAAPTPVAAQPQPFGINTIYFTGAETFPRPDWYANSGDLQVRVTYLANAGIEPPIVAPDQWANRIFATNLLSIEGFVPSVPCYDLGVYSRTIVRSYSSLGWSLIDGSDVYADSPDWVNAPWAVFTDEGEFTVNLGRTADTQPDHPGGIPVVYIHLNLQRSSAFLQISGGENNPTGIVVENAPYLSPLPVVSCTVEGGLPTTLDPAAPTTNLGTRSNPVQDPTAITVGRPAWDTHGVVDTITWRIYTAAGAYVRSGTGTTVDIAGLADGYYRVYSIVTELGATSTMAGLAPPFPHGGDAFTATAIGYIRIGDPPPLEPTEEPAIPTIRKQLRLPAGADMPTDFDGDYFHFYFNITHDHANFWPPMATMPDSVRYVQIVPPNQQPVRATFSSAMTPAPLPGSTNYQYVYVDIPINLSTVSWPRPGIYTFRITEVPNSSGLNNTQNYSVTYDTREFTLTVHVGRRNPNDMNAPLAVLHAYASLPCVGCPPEVNCVTTDCTCGCWISDKNNNNPVITFVNYFRLAAVNFEISKTVYGEMADPNHPFAFTLQFVIPNDVTLPHDIVVSAVGYNRNNGVIVPGGSVPLNLGANYVNLQPAGNTITIPAGGSRTVTRTFYLRHGDIITFTNVPIDTAFTVTEPNVVGYEQSGVAVAGGVEVDYDTAAEGANLVLSGTISALAATGSANARGVFNYVAVLNAIPDEPPMGVFLSNIPFGLMVALGAGAMAAVGTVAIAHSKAKRKR